MYDFKELGQHLKQPLRSTEWYSELMFFFNSDEYPAILEKLKDQVDLGFNFTPKLKYAFNPLLHTPYSDLKVVIVEASPVPFLSYSNGMPFNFLERPDPASALFYEHFFTDFQFDKSKKWGETIKNVHGHLCQQGFFFFNFSVTTEIDNPKSSHYQIWRPYVDRIFDIINSHPNDVLIVSLDKNLADHLKKACPKKEVIYRESPTRAYRMRSKWRAEGLKELIEERFPAINFSNIWKNL